MSVRKVTEYVVSCDWDGCKRTAIVSRSYLGPGEYVLPEGWHRLALGSYLCPGHWQERFDDLVQKNRILMKQFLDLDVDHE